VTLPATTLRARDRTLALGGEGAGPLVMGIVNATPDSFSDTRDALTVEDRVALGLALVADGADLIDVGGESGVVTTPVVEAEEEIARVVPVIEGLAAHGVLVSVDTYKPAVAAAAVAAGAAMINDVSGLLDPGLADVAARSGAALVLMHTRARPKHKVLDHPYDDVMDDVLAFLRERIDVALERGVAADQLVLDPGPDFAKTPAQTIESLRALPRLAELGRPVLLAASRKDFVGALTERGPRERLAGTLAAVGYGVDAGAHILRVHDVRDVADYLAVRGALRGDAPVEPGLRLADDLRREPTA
jgi:dihydropteroate synthase